MSETPDSDQTGRSCPNCGVENRPGNVFCTSCGANLVPENEVPERTHTEATPEGVTGEGGRDEEDDSPHESDDERGSNFPSGPVRKVGIADNAERFLEWFKREIVEGGARPGDSGYNQLGSTRAGGVPESVLQGITGRAVRWFRDLPFVTKAAVVVGALILLVLLRPLALLVAVVVFAVSFTGLIVRVGQRRSVKGWGIAAVASLVLILGFASGAIAVYGNWSAPDSQQTEALKKQREQDRKLDAELERDFDFWAENYNRTLIREGLAIQEVWPGVVDNRVFVNVDVTQESFRQPGPNPTAETFRRVHIDTICSSAASIVRKYPVHLDGVRVNNDPDGKELITCARDKENTNTTTSSKQRRSKASSG
jgi:hypothetical protein